MSNKPPAKPVPPLPQVPRTPKDQLAGKPTLDALPRIKVPLSQLDDGDDDLSAIDQFGESSATQPTEGTVVASIPVFLDDDGPLIAKEKGAASMASTQIAPLPPQFVASIDFDDGSGPPFKMTKTVTVIGRSSGAADLVLPWNEEASREHCAILFALGAFFLEDLQSSNGTYVNEQQVERVRLRAGDKIRIGSQVLVFRCRS